MQARKIIRQASLVCWVLGIPFDHPRFEQLACQLAKARMIRISPEAADTMRDKLESLCEQEHPVDSQKLHVYNTKDSARELENAI